MHPEAGIASVQQVPVVSASPRRRRARGSSRSTSRRSAGRQHERAPPRGLRDGDLRVRGAVELFYGAHLEHSVVIAEGSLLLHPPPAPPHKAYNLSETERGALRHGPQRPERSGARASSLRRPTTVRPTSACGRRRPACSALVERSGVTAPRPRGRRAQSARASRPRAVGEVVHGTRASISSADCAKRVRGIRRAVRA